MVSESGASTRPAGGVITSVGVDTSAPCDITQGSSMHTVKSRGKKKINVESKDFDIDRLQEIIGGDRLLRSVPVTSHGSRLDTSTLNIPPQRE